MASLMFCAVVTLIANIKTLLKQGKRLGFDKKTFDKMVDILYSMEIAVACKSF